MPRPALRKPKGTTLDRSGTLPALAIESAAASALTTWTGIGLLGAMAGALGGSLSSLATITWMPWAGTLASLAAGLVVPMLGSNRSASLVLLTLGRVAWAIPLGWVAWCTLHENAEPSIDSWIRLMGWTALVSSILNGIGLVALKGWIRTLIPTASHGQALALRHQAAMIASIAANGFAALLNFGRADEAASMWQLGPVKLGLLHVLAGGISLAALRAIRTRTADVRLSEPESLKSVVGPLRIPRFRKLLAFVLVYAFACHLALPYLGFLFTRELQVPLSTTLLWGMSLSAGGAIAAPYWGRIIDRRGGPARVILIATLVMAGAPAAYAWSNPQTVLWIGPIEHLLRGVLFAGYQIAVLKLIFGRSSDSELHASNAIALHQAGLGIASGLAAFVGGRLLAEGTGWLTLPQLLLVSGVAQLAVTALGLILIPLQDRPASFEQRDGSERLP